ncbi:MAG TPA: clostripain-related cysteine peptidase [Elusimicrobiales bacterium]|nr:clostripain-related cysteine peptidase [Elusimicrobiales bacterium]
MTKTIKLMSAILPALFLGTSAFAAQDFNLNSLRAADIKASGADKGIFDFIKPPKPQTGVTKEWTVMVFMNAKNNLSDGKLLGMVGKFAEKDIKEMKKIGSTDKINVVVEHGIKGKGARRLYIQKDGVLNSGEKVYGEYPNADMGDYKRVIEFVNWSKKTFPAKHYMLVLWNHGLGWIDPNQSHSNAGTGASDKGILFDDETKNYVRTRELGEILKQSGYVDVFAMNACLMQMAEVGYEVKDYTGLILASEETMLAQGFDYERLLTFMNANPAFTNEQLSDFMTGWYRQFMAGGMQIGPLTVPFGNIGATLSTVRPQALNALPGYLDAFTGAVIANNETEAVKKAIASAVRFSSLSPENDKKKEIAPYVDLYDFAAIVGANAASPAVKQAAESLMGYVKTQVVMRSVGLNSDAVNGYDYTRVGGIAINMTMKIKNMPAAVADIYETKYPDLSLSKASQWDEFMTWTDGVWRN